MTGLWSFMVEHESEILSATLEHVELVLIAMAAAILIGVPLGMLIVRQAKLAALHSRG